ncbi:MAG: hypothetical protein WD646_08965 [Actinomycetota bacterium]
MTTDSERFIEQTTIDRVVELALNTVDKPELFRSDPPREVGRLIERHGDEIVEAALARCRALVAANTGDFTAAAAARFLESCLGG